MKRFFFLLSLCLFVNYLFSQEPAPDFIVTDADDVEHELYATHLNQGQAVVIEIFFTNCPPCNALAPYLEPFYQEWGGNGSVVEFMSMSNKTYDSNADVGQYQMDHGHTFPHVGNDGGSLDAIAPYTESTTYGFFIGTPTFVVIAPDGTVTYNPTGPNFEARINAIDEALRTTGIDKPAIPHQLTGKVMRPDSTGVDSVDLIIPERDTIPEATDAEGLFDISSELVARDDYILKAQKGGDYREGISIRDLVKIQQHILGIKAMESPYELLAADADHSGEVTTQDLLQLLKLLLLVENELPDNEPWLFIDADYEFNDPTNPFPEVYDTEAALLHFTANQTTEFNLLAIKIGDVK